MIKTLNLSAKFILGHEVSPSLDDRVRAHLWHHAQSQIVGLDRTCLGNVVLKTRQAKADMNSLKYAPIQASTANQNGVLFAQVFAMNSGDRRARFFFLVFRIASHPTNATCLHQTSFIHTELSFAIRSAAATPSTSKSW